MTTPAASRSHAHEVAHGSLRRTRRGRVETWHRESPGHSVVGRPKPRSQASRTFCARTWPPRSTAKNEEGVELFGDLSGFVPPSLPTATVEALLIQAHSLVFGTCPELAVEPHPTPEQRDNALADALTNDRESAQVTKAFIDDFVTAAYRHAFKADDNVEAFKALFDVMLIVDVVVPRYGPFLEAKATDAELAQRHPAVARQVAAALSTYRGDKILNDKGEDTRAPVGPLPTVLALIGEKGNAFDGKARTRRNRRSHKPERQVEIFNYATAPVSSARQLALFKHQENRRWLRAREAQVASIRQWAQRKAEGKYPGPKPAEPDPVFIATLAESTLGTKHSGIRAFMTRAYNGAAEGGDMSA
ncbi:MAG TPA: hypothetical protein VHD87_12630 [Acidimicrobiales bacterium]|nr:hypothetical protein [Acidimicrobiales bacterium]